MDGYFSRTDGVVLVVLWFIGTAAIWYFSPPTSKQDGAPATGRKGAHASIAILALLVVAVGSAGVITGLVALSRHFALPEYLITFFVASVGTSLPELFVDITALRRGTGDLAVGDLFGSSFVDSTLSVGIGPIFAATPVTAAIVIRGGLLAAAVITLVTLLFWVTRRHDWRSGLILLIIYAATYSLLL
jgi:cation:H+ antiporter